MIADLFAGFFFIAIIYLLVKPGAKGAQAVAASGVALGSLIDAALKPAANREESTETEGISVDGNVDITNEQFGG